LHNLTTYITVPITLIFPLFSHHQEAYWVQHFKAILHPRLLIEATQKFLELVMNSALIRYLRVARRQQRETEGSVQFWECTPEIIDHFASEEGERAMLKDDLERLKRAFDEVNSRAASVANFEPGSEEAKKLLRLYSQLPRLLVAPVEGDYQMFDLVSPLI
jgi:hypothetical protein